mgnify:CR=1 FL=1
MRLFIAVKLKSELLWQLRRYQMNCIDVFQNDLGIGENELFFSSELPQPKDRDEYGRNLAYYPKAVELLDNGNLIFRI